MRYQVSREAERDLDEIFVYWAKRASLEVADRLIDNITGRFWLLGQYPDSGRPADDIAAGVKCFPAGKYLVYYRNTRRGTEILHVFHGAQDQQAAFRKSRREPSAKKSRLTHRNSACGIAEHKGNYVALFPLTEPPRGRGRAYREGLFAGRARRIDRRRSGG